MQTKVQGARRAIKRTKVWKMMCLLFMLLLFSNLTAHNDLCAEIAASSCLDLGADNCQGE